jgi:hypothetical protein
VLIQKNRDFHFDVDCRRLNDIIKKDCFPLLMTANTLHTLTKAKWFSTLDLKEWLLASGPAPQL